MEHVRRLRHYFLSMDERLASDHPTLRELESELPGARIVTVRFEDLEDASLAALQRRPELLVDPAWHRQTSYFEKLEFRFPDELKSGLDRLREDLEAGRDPNALVADARTRWGDAAMLAWTMP